MNRTPPAFRLIQTAARVPVLLSVPHAGRAYTASLLGLSRLSASTLSMLEDPFMDRVIDDAIAAGAAAIVSDVPRAEIDLNRALDDLDPAMIDESPAIARTVSTRAGAGLGLIPSRLAGHGPLWRCALSAVEVERRIATAYEPYHRAVSTTLAALRSRFGVAILLDCHSMPPRAGANAKVVLGDRGGETCGAWVIAAAEAACGEVGLPTARNDPYAGGEIVRRHGAPESNIHALQIELDRGLYMASSARPDAIGVRRTSRLIAAIASAATEESATAVPLAAK